MKHRIIFFIALAINLSLAAQNALDENGLKTGPWKVFHENDKIKYEATFDKGKPVGLMKRYGTDGSITASLYFYKNNDRCLVKMYSSAGTVEAEGIYDAKVKDSVWNYYGVDEGLRMTEEYKMGKLDGSTRSFYPSGNLSMTVHYNDGQKNGTWARFFDGGDTMMVSTYINDQLYGGFRTYFPDGKLQADGKYYKDLKDGDWSYFNEDGELVTMIKYDKGEVLNPEELEKNYEKFIKELDDVVKDTLWNKNE